MAKERTVDYDFYWNIENFTDCNSKSRKSEQFSPLSGKNSEVDKVFHPEFFINFGCCELKKDKCAVSFSLNTWKSLRFDLRFQLAITIKSISVEKAEYTNPKIYFLDTLHVLHLFTVVVKSETLRIADKVIAFSPFHNFLSLKCRFKFFFVLPVISKSAIGLASNDLRKKHCNLCSDFKNLYDSKEMADITITVGNDSLLAHKFVLVTRSPVFKAMLGHDCLESNKKTIQITDVDVSVFDCFLQYLYCCEIGDKSFDTVRNLYVLADKYAVDGLKGECRDMLEAELRMDSVFQLLELSHLHKDESLKKETVGFIEQNFSEVSKRPEWMKMCADCPELASEVLRMVTLFLDKTKSN